MFKILIRFVLTIITLHAAVGTALADIIEGRVADVSPGHLDMVVYDPQGQPYPNQLRLGVDYRTEVSGVKSILDLEPNDPVSADITQLESGNWYAQSVTLFQELHTQPATKKPSPSLKGFLGNPVARGALLGAATGAIASSSSGGKTGKGALVGAGVGAAAGLLGQLFSGQGQSPESVDSNQYQE